MFLLSGVAWPDMSIRQRSETIFSHVFQSCPSQTRDADHPGTRAALHCKLLLPSCVIKLFAPVVIQWEFSFYFLPLLSCFPFCGYFSCSSSFLFPKYNWFLSINFPQMCRVPDYDEETISGHIWMCKYPAAAFLSVQLVGKNTSEAKSYVYIYQYRQIDTHAESSSQQIL